MMKNIVTLLQDYDEIVDGIYTEVSISASGILKGKEYNANGLWDTGSTRSCINEKIKK